MTTGVLNAPQLKMLKRIAKGKAPILDDRADRLTLQSLSIDGYLKISKVPATYSITPKGHAALEPADA